MSASTLSKVHQHNKKRINIIKSASTLSKTHQHYQKRILSHNQDCNFPPESVPIGAVGPPLDVFLFPHLPRPIWVHPG